MGQSVIVGDVRALPLEAESVHLIVTSPPYWSLRDYGIAPSVWGGDPECVHTWKPQAASRGREGKKRWNYDPADNASRVAATLSHGDACDCGAWLGCLGLEPTPEEYIAHMIEALWECWRVLRPDGVLVLNIGDSFASGYKGTGGDTPKQKRNAGAYSGGRVVDYGLPAKSKGMIPARVAIAAQMNGWTLRSDVVWLKHNPMPESCRDRPTTAHEYVYVLTKGPRYWWDADAIRQEPAYAIRERREHPGRVPRLGSPSTLVAGNHAEGRNFRTSDLVLDDEGVPIVYVCATRGFPGAHFATFPRELVLPFVKAACPPKACTACGKGWIRDREKVGTFQRRWGKGNADGSPYGAQGSDQNVYAVGGWAPACECEAEAVPGTVLDPFAGSGTVGVVAAALGRNYVGVDVSAEYVKMANERIDREGRGTPAPTKDNAGRRATQLSLFA